MNNRDNEKLKLLPKYEEYVVYVNKMIITSPKCCRLSIGDELRKSMYNMSIKYTNLISKR